MPKYSVSIEVKAQRLPDPEEPPEMKPGSDPLTALAATAGKMFSGGPAVFALPSKASGVEMARNITVTAESFAAIAGILGKFDELAERLECEHP